MTQRVGSETRGGGSASLSEELRNRFAERPSRYHLGDGPLLARQRHRESSARSYPRRIPIALRRAQGIYVEDSEGRVFIDCLAGAGTLSVGHNHPVVLEALHKALRDGLPMQTLDLTTSVKDQLMEQVCSLLPPEFASRARIQFCGPTGADAVEAALKLVRTATRRRGLLAFQGAYHGMSQGALSLMGNRDPKRELDGVLGLTQFLPFPYSYRCPFGLGGSAGERAGLAYIENLLSDPEGGVLPPAGVIVEPVQGEGGVIPAPASWLQRLRHLATAHGIPLIMDEVQTGLGRTGKVFAFEHADIYPDVLVLSKALGGGLPLSVVVYDDSLDTWSPGAHAGTFRGNQLAMVTGLAAIDVLKHEALEQAAEAQGAQLMRGLEALQKRFSLIGDVRGLGLMVGIEVVAPKGPRDRCGHPPPDTSAARALQRACLCRGLILELGGRYGATLRFLPPLIIRPREIDLVLSILESALEEVAEAPLARGDDALESAS